jgi:hypothetical protein
MLELKNGASPPEEPAAGEEQAWDSLDGEQPDSATRHALNLAHQAVGRFPDLARRYRRFTGPAAVVSGGLVLLAGIAISRRLRLGEQPDEILDSLTPAEIESAAVVEQEEKVARHRQIQTQIQGMWSRFKPGRKQDKPAPEPEDR